MKKLNRRQFLKLGAAVSATTALSETSPLKAGAAELVKGGEDVQRSGIDWGAAGKKLEAKPGVCLQCGVTDGLVGFVENGRLVKVEGSVKHPNTRGRLCAKGQAGPQLVYDPYRIKWPMMRKGERGDPNAKWERISMDEAIDEVVKRLKDIRREDPGRYVFHQGRNRFPLFTKRFNAAMGTKHIFEHTSICESSLKVGYVSSFGRDLDASNAALGTKIVLDFGSNIYEAAYMHVAMPQRITEARVDGCRYISFDPRLSHTAGRADEWYPVNPGTDAAVILAMANVIMRENLANTDFLDQWTTYPSDKLKDYLKDFTPEWAEKISGVPAKDISRLAIEFGKASPFCFARAYNGLSNHTNGAYNTRCLAMLNAVVGNIDQPGGFAMLKFTGFGKVEPEPDVDKVLAEIGHPDAEFPIEEDGKEKFPLAQFGTAHLLPLRLKELNYQIGLYLLHMYNPLYANPDRELWLEVLSQRKYADFILDFSPYWSETAKEVADLIIPDTTYLEKFMVNDMPSVENIPFIQLWQPVIKPLYSRSMYDTMTEIARRVGGGAEKYFAFDSVEDFIKEAVDNKWGDGAYERLKKDGVLIGKKYDPATYKSFNDLTEKEKAGLRQFDVFRETISEADLARLRGERAVVGTEKKQGAAEFTSAPILDKGGKTIGVMKNGTAYKGFPTPTGLFEIFSPAFEKHGFEALPAYVPVRTENLKDGELIMITGKINVQTQSRTQNLWPLMEITGYNPAWINPEVAKKLGLEEEDDVFIESDWGVKKIPCRVHITEGINPKCVFLSTHFGHWEYGPLANKGIDPITGEPMWPENKVLPGTPFQKGFDRRTTANLNPAIPPAEISVSSPTRIFANDLIKAKKLPVTKDYKGRTTVGWSPNAILPADEETTDPVGGEYAWSDTPVRIRKA